MRKYSQFLMGTAVGAAVCFVMFSSGLAPVGSSAIATPASVKSYRHLELFNRVLDIVRTSYVERPDETKLVTSAINGMVSSLDPHSSYMDAKSYRDMQSDTRGEFGGLGMEVTMEDGVVKVVSPIDDTPAARAGVSAGDVITEVDGSSVKDLTLNQVVDLLRGAIGTEVRLQLMRKEQDNPLNLMLTRQLIKVNSVRFRDEGGDVGYIRITQFNNRASTELKKAVAKLASQTPPAQVKGYILDLRNNPGGLLDEAVAVSDAFLNHGDIVSIKGRDAVDVQRFSAKPGDIVDGKPVIVLINGGSASASEIVAGALKDQKRATVIGSRSFGKASVQTIIPLGPGNGAVRLTTARYYTPSGFSLQAQGIEPDIEVLQEVPKQLESQNPSMSESALKGHLKAEGKERQGSQSYVPPVQQDDKALQSALALLRGTASNPAFPPKPRQAQVH